MGLSRTVSEIDGDFSRKSQTFSHPLYFAPLLKGFLLEFGTGAGVQKTRIMGLPGWGRSLTISSAIWIQCTNVTDGQMDSRTDGQTDTGWQQRPRLRIAPRGKNGNASTLAVAVWQIDLGYIRAGHSRLYRTLNKRLSCVEYWLAIERH